MAEIVDDLNENYLICEKIENVKSELDKAECNNNIKIFHVNLRSLRKNWDLLETCLMRSNVEWDLIFLSEIGIKKEETSHYSLKNFTAIWITRDTTRLGGGIVVFINNKYKLHYDYKASKIEENDVIELKLLLKETTLNFIFPYRQPKTDIKMFLRGLQDKLEEYETQDNVIWLGDINIDIWDSKQEKKTNKTIRDQYENILANKGFEKKINSVTREEIKGTKITQSCIDHLFIKSKSLHSCGIVIHEKIADHYITAGLIVNDKERLSGNKINKVIKYRNDKKIIKNLKEMDWAYLDTFKDPDDMYDEIVSVIEKIYNQNTKEKEKKATGKNKKIKKQWVTEKNLHDIREKNNLWHRIKVNKTKNKPLDSELLKKYRILRHKIRKEIEENKQNFYKGQIIKNRNMWEMVNKLTNQQVNNIDETIKKNFKGCKSKEIADKFNKNFIELTERLKFKYKRKAKKEKGQSNQYKIKNSVK